MHGKRDQNGSVNVLGPAALTLAVPLRFTMHVCVCVCVCVCERERERERERQEVCACKDGLHPCFFFGVTDFDYKLPSYGENKTLSCIRMRIYCHRHKPSWK